MHERFSGVSIRGPSHSSELTKSVKTRRTNSGDLLIYAQVQVGRKEEAKDPDIVARQSARLFYHQSAEMDRCYPVRLLGISQQLRLLRVEL